MEKFNRTLNYGIFGDICGSSLEGKFNNSISDIKELFDKGCKTDDSEMTLAVYDCLKEKKISSRDFLDSFVKHCKNEKSYSEKTLFIIKNCRQNFSEKNAHDTNGAIMRAMPFAVIEDLNLRKISMENNLVHTHWNLSALETCLDYVEYLRILMREGKKLFKSPTSSELKFRIMLCNTNLGKKVSEIPECFTQNGFVVKNCDTFAYVYYFFINHEEGNYEEGLKEILKRGGDTDTTAKIYCEMVGCVSSCFDKYIKVKN